jgi:hypothetical protein
VREVISNTSPLQYLYQAELLDLLPALYGTIVELAEGRTRKRHERQGLLVEPDALRAAGSGPCER